jgi:hypothetical protein
VIDWTAIAGRIHGLVHVTPAAAGAERGSRPDPLALRRQLQNAPLSQAVRTLENVVRLYGLDPSWVVTGHYDPSTHRAALDGSDEEARALIQRLLFAEISGASERRPETEAR